MGRRLRGGDRWNHLATTALVKDYNGFDFQKDFPAVYRYAQLSHSSAETVILTASP